MFTKNTIFALLIAFTFACSKPEPVEPKVFGAEFVSENVISAEELMTTMSDKEEMDATVKGTVVEVCQEAGCWLTVDIGEGKEPLRVRMKDHDFAVPKDITGKTIEFSGTSFNEQLSVDAQKHYLVDAKAPQEEIDAITEPKQAITFDAAGVKVY